MILIDMSQILIANYMAERYRSSKSRDQFVQYDYEGAPTIDIFRHLVWNAVRAFNHSFSREWGTPVLCFDSGTNWRKDVFPLYKAHRKKAREKSEIDWDEMFKDCINPLVKELQTESPYKCLQIPRAEADDIIGTLARHFRSRGEPVLIVSGDGDFDQLQKFGARRYDPLKKGMVEANDPELLLFEKICTGDRGDGIPNILSDIDTLATDGKRQKSLRKKLLAEWVRQEEVPLECHERFKENQRLIDLTFTPQDVQDNILEEFAKATPKPRSHLMTYFMSHGMKYLIGRLDEF